MSTIAMAGDTGGDYLAAIRDAHGDPQRLEALYRSALGGGAAPQFAEALRASYEEFPTNLLYAAWYYRLHGEAGPTTQTQEVARDGRVGTTTNWRLAIPLSIGLAL